MSEYKLMKQEPQDQYDSDSPRLQHHLYSTSDHEKRNKTNEPRYPRQQSGHQDENSPRRQRSSVDRQRSMSPPTQKRSLTRSRREHKPEKITEVVVWTGHSYNKTASGYVVGIGLQFDNQIKTSLQVAIHTKNRSPSHHAELLGVLLTLAILKWKKLEDVNITINTNQPVVARLMNRKEYPCSGEVERDPLAKFVYNCVDQWARPVYIQVGTRKDDLLGMKAAKTRAVAIRKRMERSQTTLPPFPPCLWSTIYGQGLTSCLNLPERHRAPPPLSEFLEESTVASTLSFSSHEDFKQPPIQSNEPSQLHKTQNPSQSSLPQPPPASEKPPNPSTTNTNATKPKDWPKSLPYPIPFEIASQLIAQLVAITAPPTQEDIDNMASQTNPIPMPPLPQQQQQQQQQQPSYYPPQPAFMSTSHGHHNVALYQSTPPPYPQQYITGQQYQHYLHQFPSYYHSPQQLPLRSPIYPDHQRNQSPAPTEYNNSLTRPVETKGMTPTEGPSPPPGYGSAIIHPSRTGIVDLGKQPTEDTIASVSSQQTPPQTPAYQIQPKGQ